MKRSNLVVELPKGYKWKANLLQAYAERLSNYPVKEEEVLNVDMTNLFLLEIERQVRCKEIIKMQVGGKMRLGKSTIAITLGVHIQDLINKYFECDKEFSIRNIARDNQEKSKLMRDKDLNYTVIVTDEENALGETGENATVEVAEANVYSNIHAGRYVHDINCSPSGVIDPNSDIMLEVRAKDKGMTHCRLYYNLRGNWVLCGHVNINVSFLIESWIKKVEPRFTKWLLYGKEVDKIYIDKWVKKDWYVEYVIRKFEKMDLLTKEGIFRPKELDYAKIALEIVRELENLSRMKMLNPKLIRSFVESYYRREKLPYSLIGIRNASERIEGILSLVENHERLLVLSKKLDNEYYIKKKLSKEEYSTKKSVLNDNWKTVGKLIDTSIGELEHYKEVAERYNKYG